MIVALYTLARTESNHAIAIERVFVVGRGETHLQHLQVCQPKRDSAVNGRL
jgi:hypothetical protein